MIAEESEYKGNKTLTFKRDEEDRYPFSFGLSKAKIILANIDRIKEFVEKYDGKKSEPGPVPADTTNMPF